MEDFSFHAPDTLDEALALLQQLGEEARVIAGGTALVTLMRQSLVQFDHLISLGNIKELRGISQVNGHIHIGASVRHREVETSKLIQESIPLLAEVYSRVATVRIRNTATVGGGLAHADPAQDPPPGLLVLDARVSLKSAGGQRTVPVSELFSDYYETIIQPDEILTEIIVPVSNPSSRTVYIKYLPRTADDFATVSVAASAILEDNRCEDIRVALAAVAATPIRAVEVEDLIRGQEVSHETIRRAAQAVADSVDPLDDFRGSSDYKREMAVIFTRRALERVLGLEQ